MGSELAKTTRLTDFDDLKETVIQCSAARKKKPAAFKAAESESENELLSSFL